MNFGRGTSNRGIGAQPTASSAAQPTDAGTHSFDAHLFEVGWWRYARSVVADVADEHFPVGDFLKDVLPSLLLPIAWPVLLFTEGAHRIWTKRMRITFYPAWGHVVLLYLLYLYYVEDRFRIELVTVGSVLVYAYVGVSIHYVSIGRHNRWVIDDVSLKTLKTMLAASEDPLVTAQRRAGVDLHRLKVRVFTTDLPTRLAGRIKVPGLVTGPNSGSGRGRSGILQWASMRFASGTSASGSNGGAVGKKDSRRAAVAVSVEPDPDGNDDEARGNGLPQERLLPGERASGMNRGGAVDKDGSAVATDERPLKAVTQGFVDAVQAATKHIPMRLWHPAVAAARRAAGAGSDGPGDRGTFTGTNLNSAAMASSSHNARAGTKVGGTAGNGNSTGATQAMQAPPPNFCVWELDCDVVARELVALSNQSSGAFVTSRIMKVAWVLACVVCVVPATLRGFAAPSWADVPATAFGDDPWSIAATVLGASTMYHHAAIIIRWYQRMHDGVSKKHKRLSVLSAVLEPATASCMRLPFFDLHEPRNGLAWDAIRQTMLEYQRVNHANCDVILNRMFAQSTIVYVVMLLLLVGRLVCVFTFEAATLNILAVTLLVLMVPTGAIMVGHARANTALRGLSKDLSRVEGGLLHDLAMMVALEDDGGVGGGGVGGGGGGGDGGSSAALVSGVSSAGVGRGGTRPPKDILDEADELVTTVVSAAEMSGGESSDGALFGDNGRRASLRTELMRARDRREARRSVLSLALEIARTQRTVVTEGPPAVTLLGIEVNVTVLRAMVTVLFAALSATTTVREDSCGAA